MLRPVLQVDGLRKSVQELGKSYASRASSAPNKQAALLLAAEGMEGLVKAYGAGAKHVDALKDMAKKLRALPHVELGEPTLALVVGGGWQGCAEGEGSWDGIGWLAQYGCDLVFAAGEQMLVGCLRAVLQLHDLYLCHFGWNGRTRPTSTGIMSPCNAVALF